MKEENGLTYLYFEDARGKYYNDFRFPETGSDYGCYALIYGNNDMLLEVEFDLHDGNILSLKFEHAIDVKGFTLQEVLDVA